MYSSRHRPEIDVYILTRPARVEQVRQTNNILIRDKDCEEGCVGGAPPRISVLWGRKLHVETQQLENVSRYRAAIRSTTSRTTRVHP